MSNFSEGAFFELAIIEMTCGVPNNIEKHYVTELKIPFYDK